MPDAQITVPAVSAAPAEYSVSGAADFILKAVNANMDGSGAAATWLPCVEIVSDSGHVVARAVDQAVSVAAGGSAEVSWFPRVRRRATTTPATTAGCQLLGSANGTDTLTVTLTSAVPAAGILQVVFSAVTVGVPGDGASAPNAASDSAAVAGWITNASSGQAQIGLSRQTVDPGAPSFTMIVGSVLRPCTAADLGVGGTITVGFHTSSPANFKTAGLAVWTHGFIDAIRQQDPPFFPAVQYGNGDSYPDFSSDPTTLRWSNDYFFWDTFAVRDAIMVTAMGAYPATAGFAPFTGTLIGEKADGDTSIASACTAIPWNTVPEPGGTWPAGSQQAIDGNYQMDYPRTFS